MHSPYILTKAPTSFAAQPDGAYGTGVGLRDLTAYLRSSWRLIAGCAVMFGAAALAYSLVTPPVFTASAQLILDPGKAQVVFGDAREPDRLPDQARVESQVEVIKSESIALAVVRRLRLVDDPEFVDDTPPSAWNPLAWFTSAAEDQDPVQVRERQAISAYQNRLTVRRVGQSLVIEVAFSSNRPAKSAEIANAIADVYIRQDIANKSEAARRGVDWLSERLAELRQQTYDALRTYERFKLVGDKDSGDEPQVKLAELESISQSYRRVYDVFLQQFTETLQKVSYPESDARVISAATPPRGKSHPKTKLIVAFGTLFGLMAGTTLSWARYSVDRTVTPQRVTSELNLNWLGTVRRFTPAPPSAGWWSGLFPSGRAARSAGTPMLNAFEDTPSAPAAQDLRRLRNAVNCTLLGRTSRAIGVLAASSGEGATTIAANYAIACARAGTRTLLVDACHDEPRLSRELAGAEQQTGLTEIVADSALSARTIAQLAKQRFAVLPMGAATDGPNPVDRIGSDAAALQISDLTGAFDLVVFDLPALDASPDALALIPFLDGIVVVADATSTSLDRLSGARDAILAASGTVLGVVLNKVPSPAAAR
ncbi:polysaccharide biosynthesis tyrosine autokinase [Rhodoplanes sp. TEM]|uniref:Polysaccharide biosynthesis tyrosine autokinase n=1 Tax=Rhodoplanes tepidamans TaxID=200616 RepID=A0ABT5J779_RHOTP|nr:MULTISPECIES: polysaccharide biosynthesis tyrosine autokinase [Rhodoplanes]MDC7785241.1 polysaccharide biosynthesis tyrosine autokinase [Rhodoplanes tepidamans]MDC7986407.1 polysaccharide biosynthesis tyrosine autokinase [Rhodoplanes sp. TEM]MDQ0353499.1 uncharacterized protein involved in exopolysaccharide biosynthesis/Mrp family chromosome partitioning ATPase [Rhodoplanes tepidamans]